MEPPRFLHRLAWLYATVGGIGLLRPAPGTWGSIPGFAAAWWATSIGAPVWIILLAATAGLALAIPASTIAARMMGKKDPGSIVADEAFSTPIAAWPLIAQGNLDWRWWLTAFVLFRIFDISKLWPACQLERLPEGTGIVVDDVASAAWASLVLWVLLAWLTP